MGNSKQVQNYDGLIKVICKAHCASQILHKRF